jgi:pyruvate/2-oxoacid:ferredoxin oxidoreductase beta subunit
MRLMCRTRLAILIFSRNNNSRVAIGVASHTAGESLAEKANLAVVGGDGLAYDLLRGT